MKSYEQIPGQTSAVTPVAMTSGERTDSRESRKITDRRPSSRSTVNQLRAIENSDKIMSQLALQLKVDQSQSTPDFEMSPLQRTSSSSNVVQRVNFQDLKNMAWEKARNWVTAPIFDTFVHAVNPESNLSKVQRATLIAAATTALAWEKVHITLGLLGADPGLIDAIKVQRKLDEQDQQ